MGAVTSENGIETLKSRLHSTWTAGDYDLFSRYMENDARAFYERLDVPPGAGCWTWPADPDSCR